MPKPENSLNDFGLLIAYLLPGFVALWGVGLVDPTVKAWLGTAPEHAATLSGFLLSTVAALAAGLTLHTVRWLIIDTIHHRTGIRPKTWDFSLLQDRLAAYDRLTENHYRFHQWYGGMVVALAWLVAARHLAVLSAMPDCTDGGILLLGVLFWLGSRDALRRYYLRVDAVLATA